MKNGIGKVCISVSEFEIYVRACIGAGRGARAGVSPGLENVAEGSTRKVDAGRPVLEQVKMRSFRFRGRPDGGGGVR